MVIAHNISAMNTYNKMGVSSTAADKSMEKLSSGYAINRAADDAAGLSISEKMRSQIRGLNQASDNAQQGISMIQTAEGALNEAHSICQRMRELAVQAANDTNAASDREALQSEMNQLTSEINRIGNTTEFNGMKLLNGSKVTTTGKEDIEIANGGTIASFANAQGATNTAELVLTDPIKFTGTGDVLYSQLQAKEGVNTVEISKKDGKLVATINLVEAKGDGTVAAADVYTAGVNTANYDAEELIQAENGDWIYNNHGISFAISKESAQEFITNGEETDSATIDLYKATGSTGAAVINATRAAGFNINNEYESDSAANGTITNMTLAAWGTGVSRIDYDRVEVEFTNAAVGSAATLTVKYFNDSDQVLTDTISMDGLGTIASGKATTKSYSANGLSFTLNFDENFKATDKIHLNVDLDKKLTTSTVQGNGQGTDNSVYFHVGANTNQVINTTFGDMRAAALKLTGTGDAYTEEFTVNNGSESTSTERGLNISTRAGANSAIDIIDDAVTAISQERSKYGAIQNRLEYTINNVDTTSENMTSAESTIRDVDMASEMMELTKNQILQQASQAMLSQAMQRPQQVLQLLQG